MKKKNAFTLVEILIAVVIVGILSSIAAYFYKDSVNKAKASEAFANVKTISQAEHIKMAETDKYLSAENIDEINKKLDLNIVPKYYEYRVTGVTEDDFVVIAKRIGEDIETSKLSSELLVVAMNSSGAMPSGYEQYIGASGSGGLGGTAVTTGGSGGGSSGGADTGGVSGGTTGGSGGSSGGGTGGGGSGGGTGGGSGGSGTSVSTPVYDSDLVAALNLLKGSVATNYYYNFIQDNSISIKYGDFSKYPDSGASSAAALWQSTTKVVSYPDGSQVSWLANTIYVNQTQKTEAPEPAIAALIAHEGTHADYDYNPAKWIESTLAKYPGLVKGDLHITTSPYNSIDQEYNCFEAQVKTWKELKGAYSDGNNDAWSAWYDQGESYMKDKIKKYYPSLQQY